MAVKREAMALVSDRIAFLQAQVVDALDEVDLLVGVAVGELVVVREIEALGERVTDVVLVADAAELLGRWATLAMRPSYQDLACDWRSVMLSVMPLSGSVSVQGAGSPGHCT